MGPWLRRFLVLLTALSTATARAQGEQPRSRPAQSQPDPAQQRIGQLEQQIARLQAELDRLRADQRAAAAAQQRRLDDLQRQTEEVAERGRALEENRRLRLTWWSQALGAILAANDVLATGSSDVAGLLGGARSLAEQAASGASGFGSAREAAQGRDALTALDDVAGWIGQGDLAHARHSAALAAQAVEAARSIAQGAAAPLYLPAP